MPTPTMNSIHTLGRGNLGKINAKYPFKTPPQTQSQTQQHSNGDTERHDSNDYNTTATTGNTTKEPIANSDQSSEVIVSSSRPDKDVSELETARTRSTSNKSSFNALVSKFGGNSNNRNNTQINKQGQGGYKKFDSNVSSGEYVLGGGGAANTNSAAAESNNMVHDSQGQEVLEVCPNNGDATNGNGNASPKFSFGQSKKISYPFSMNKSLTPRNTANKDDYEQSKSKSHPSGSSSGKLSKKASFLPTASMKKMSYGNSNISSSSKHQSKQQQHQVRSTKSLPQSQSSRTGRGGTSGSMPPQSSHPQQRRRVPTKAHHHHNHHSSRTSNTATTSNTNNRSSASSSSKQNNNNMVQPKSHQRLVLEHVAAQYFMNNEKNHSNNGRYVGVIDYGDGYYNTNNDSSNNHHHLRYTDNNGLGHIDEENSSEPLNYDVTPPPLGLSEEGVKNRDREDVVAFLEGRPAKDDNTVEDEDDQGKDEDEGHQDDAKNVNFSLTSEGGSFSTLEISNKHQRQQQQQQQEVNEIQQETNIDRILEMASDYLSLGKNDLALQAYRRAMKCAFADVISVKHKLVEVKKMQAQGNLDTSTSELTRLQEQQFELTLLQVASRVADVHNNMGVVHEMNRHYTKARVSYVDALEVYHNTCKRFEERGDPDVDRTKKNVERMTLACSSEKQRKELHERAAKIGKRVGYEKHFSQRRALLQEAVGTLRNALDIEGGTIGMSHPVAASTLIQIGKYLYEMREYDEAVVEIRRAITILRNALGGNHPQVGKSTLLLASIYERHGVHISPEGESKDDSELELYVDALESLKATLGEVHPEVGFLYVKIGHLYGKKEDANLSLLAYKAALKAYGEPSSSSTSGEVHPEVVSIWVRVTEHLTTLKSWDNVVVAGRRALYLLRRSKNTLFHNARHASSNLNAGGAPISSGASVTSQIPNPATAKSSKRSRIQITPETYLDSLFLILQCLGQAHTSLSHYALARDACSESLQLAWEMSLSTNSRAKTETLNNSVLQVIRALKRLGKAYLLEKHYTAALECFLPSLELLRSSKEMESTLDCASVLGSLGFLYLKLKKFTESSNFLRECLRLYQKNGVDINDRETRKVQAWLEMAESREEEIASLPPSFLEIPTIVFDDANGNKI